MNTDNHHDQYTLLSRGKREHPGRPPKIFSTLWSNKDRHHAGYMRTCAMSDSSSGGTTLSSKRHRSSMYLSFSKMRKVMLARRGSIAWGRRRFTTVALAAAMMMRRRRRGTRIACMSGVEEKERDMETMMITSLCDTMGSALGTGVASSTRRDDTSSKTPLVDYARPLYGTLDWTMCVIGGSYALQQFTQDTTWSPNDIDIPCALKTHDEFVAEVERLKTAMQGTEVTKMKLWTPELRAQHGRDNPGPDEKFHRSIIATAVLAVPGIALPVQLVGVDITTGPRFSAGLLEHLAQITDSPARVSYTENGPRIYHVPMGDLEPIMSRRIPSWKICPARKAKYTARGYTFYDA